MGSNLVKYATYLIFLPFWWGLRLFPRNNNIWVFGSWYGQRFSDNSMYLFKQVLNHNPEIRPIWITSNKKIALSNQNNGLETYMKWSLRGIWYCMRAKYVFVTSRKQDVNEFFINGATLVNLWHGSPLKKIGADDHYSRVNGFFYGKVVKNLFPISYEFNYDFVVSNASIFTDKMATSFKLDVSKVLETGCPRNDVFYNQEMDGFNKKLVQKFPKAKLVYYLPTFRNSEKPENIFTQNDYDPAKVEAFLQRENIVLVNKGHFVESKRESVSNTDNSRVIHLKDDDITSDINFMLKDADALITDYSSAFFDFLLTERPIIFAAFDLHEYISKSRELYFDYKEAVAGPIANNWSEIFFYLETIWNDTNYQDLVKQKNKLYNKFHDNQNSERVVNVFNRN